MSDHDHRLFIRKCHHCEAITERQGQPVEHCDSCGRSLGLYYFFRETEIEPLSDDRLRPRPNHKEFNLPVRGLSVCW